LGYFIAGMWPPTHPRLELWLEIGKALDIAVSTGARRAHAALRSRRKRPYRTRRPGFASPLWNVCATQLRRALVRRGAKARLARYLGIPRQRLTDFLRARTRLPDAELTLRLLHWLAEHRAGRDPSL
jgi:hypothetical protein